VRQARLKAELSLAQVAGTDLTRQAVHLIETGKVRPSLRSLQIIARRLGVPAHTFQVAPEVETGPPQPWAAELERLCDRQRYDEVVDLARGLMSEGASVLQRAVAHLYLGRGLLHLGDAIEAMRHLRQARRLFEQEGDQWSAAEALEGEAGALYQQEDPRALSVSEEALRQYRSLEPRRADVEARMLEHLATCLIQRGDLTRAYQCYEDALRIAGKILDLTRLARIYHGMGRCHFSLGDPRRAIDLLSRAVALNAVEQDLRPLPARIDLPRAENDLGMLLMYDGQLGRAEECFLAALRHLEEAGGRRLRSHLLVSLAELRQRQGELDEAVRLTEEAIEHATSLQERIALASACQQLGRLRVERQEHQLAEQAFDRALAIFEELGMVGPRDECLAARRSARERRSAGARLERSAG